MKRKKHCRIYLETIVIQNTNKSIFMNNYKEIANNIDINMM